MNKILPHDRKQYKMLLCLDEEISSDNPVRIIDAIVARLIKEQESIQQPDKGSRAGRPGYMDTTMIKLFIYGYINRINSSRRLETEARRNIELRWLLGELVPDHWTISNYRKEKGELIKEITRQLRRFLREKEYIGLATVSLDGSKIKANAAKQMETREGLEKKISKIEETIEGYLSKIGEIDEAEDIEGESCIENRAEVYISQIKGLKKEIEDLRKAKEILEENNRRYISLTDKESRLMLCRDGKQPAYNVQLVVDSKHRLIVDSEVCTEESDGRLLEKMLESTKEEVEELPKEILADSGYSDLNTLEELEKKYKESGEELDIYVSQEKNSEERKPIKFKYDKERDEYKCPEGKRLRLMQKNKPKGRNGMMDAYQGLECDGCLQRHNCTRSKKGRIVHRYKNQQWRDDYVREMLSQSSLDKLKKRRGMIEHVFGTLKRWMGKVPLLLRGQRKVRTEINLITTAYNIKRLINIEGFNRIMQLITGDQVKMA